MVFQFGFVILLIESFFHCVSITFTTICLTTIKIKRNHTLISSNRIETLHFTQFHSLETSLLGSYIPLCSLHLFAIISKKFIETERITFYVFKSTLRIEQYVKCTIYTNLCVYFVCICLDFTSLEYRHRVNFHKQPPTHKNRRKKNMKIVLRSIVFWQKGCCLQTFRLYDGFCIYRCVRLRV